MPMDSRGPQSQWNQREFETAQRQANFKLANTARICTNEFENIFFLNGQEGGGMRDFGGGGNNKNKLFKLEKHRHRITQEQSHI
jgi:hypothetical protein